MVKQFKFIDLEFLSNLKKDTVESNPNLISELLQIYFEVFPSKMSELRKFANQKNKIDTLKVAHFLKGQSACVGLHYCKKEFLKIENLAMGNHFAEVAATLDQLDLLLPELEAEVQNYINQG